MTFLEEIPSEVRNFIVRYIDSIELIQILILFRANPTKEWTIEELNSELRSSTLGIEKRLSDLYDRKVLQKGKDLDKHGYTPYNEDTRRQIDELAKYNQVYPYRVMELLYSRRDEAMREFANAFNFKKDR